MKRGVVVAERVLTTDEVADLFRVSPAQVKRWAADPRYRRQLGAFKTTPRGHYRYPEGKVRKALACGLVDDEELAS